MQPNHSNITPAATHITPSDKRRSTGDTQPNHRDITFIGLKEGFCRVCIEKGARSFVGEK